MAKSMTRIGTRNYPQGVQAPQIRMALFLCPYDSSGGLRAEAFGLAGFLVGR
ncbi:conserved hypothetical protein [delta proteobacterium NaphS2]|nr:conserved hypothetical protein [delta proteobacterium NaphS2]